jgi:long-chain acyl-CoA synthetase
MRQRARSTAHGARRTLLDFFEDLATLDGPFLVHDDGYSVRQTTYRELAAAARAFAARLAAERIAAGEHIVIWSENRNEWVAALWGAMLAGVVVVPVDFRASADLLERISRIVSAKAVLAGAEVTPPASLEAPVWRLIEVIDLREPDAPAAEAPKAGPDPGSLVEIIFTSGATGDPKGVTITHRNILANIVPIEREVKKYRRYERPFHPIRFLNLLPLSHMFGQSLATFVPPMLGGTVIFSHGYSPVEILRQITSRRVSVLVCVPKVLDVLRHHVERLAPETMAPDALEGRHWAWRWWRYRRVHRMFGWKFWAVVVGAAPLDPDLEAFWRKLGFVVVQGYGLTETAPVVTLNHPFRAARGTVGRPIAGVDVRIAPDGEVLVRGDNVTTGYFQPGSAAPVHPPEAFTDGWFHTGDIGEIDDAGRLLIKGRKKEMIVTPQGLNVFPEDVERALLAQPGVLEAAVVGVPVEGEERVHAVLVLEPDADASAVVRAANQGLEDHQLVRSSSIWPGDRLPRTEGTAKLKRRELQHWAAGGMPAPGAAGPERSIEDVVGRFASGRTITPETSLAELGLSSLDRVELLMVLEEVFHTTLDEAQLAAAVTVADLGTLVAEPAGRPGSRALAAGPEAARPEAAGTAPAPRAIPFPSWNRTRAAHALRRVSLPTWILPLGRIFMRIQAAGLERLAGLQGPAIFAANHQSLLDVPAILLSLPPEWRYRIAPAMAKELFAAHFDRGRFGWRKWATNSLSYYLACQFFNAFPLPQREAGTRQALRYMGEVAGDGYSILIFPEGERTITGEIGRFRSGVGMSGARLGLPIVPVRLEGLDRVLHRRMRFPKRGPVRVTFGEPIQPSGEDYAGLAARVEQAVRSLRA